MLTEQNKFVVKSKTKGLLAKKSFDILDEAGDVLATASDATGFLAGLLGGANIEVRDASSDNLVFSLSRTGLLFKKDQVKDSKGEVVGRYKAKLLSLSPGFNIYDKDGKHVGIIQGKMLKAEYKFLTPDKKTEMGSVSRTWGGLAKSFLTGNDTFGVQIEPDYADDAQVKMLILGATIALESIFKKKESKSEGSSSSDE